MPRPQPIAEVLAELMARRGYARELSSAECAEAWRRACGELAGWTRPGSIRRGVLEVFVANSALLQEITFRKTELLAELARLLPDQPIKDLRFRVGAVT